MIDFIKIGRVVDEYVANIVKENPQLAREINEIVDQFHVKFRQFKIDETADIFELCKSVDRLLRLNRLEEPLLSIVNMVRTSIQQALFDLHFDEEKKQVYGQFGMLNVLEQKKELAKCLAEMMPAIRAKLAAMPQPLPSDFKFNQQWLQVEANGSGIFERMKEAVTDKATGVQHWAYLKQMLPKDIRNYFDISYTMVKDTEFAHMVQVFKPLALMFGIDVVAQFLISTGRVKMSFSKTVRILAEYIGKHRVPDTKPPDPSRVSDEFLELTDVRLLLFIMYRNRIYKELIVEGERPIESYVVRFSTIIEKIKNEFDQDKPLHKELYDSVVDYWQDVFAIEVPARMVSAIERKDHTFGEFPSLRQRIAMKEMKGGNRVIHENPDGKKEIVLDGHRKLLGFFMGLGKTGSAFLSREYVGSKKMLYICPINTLAELPAQILGYYKKDPASVPTIGIIGEGMTEGAKREALKAEIVIVPYTMLRPEILPMLQAERFDFLTVDEVHSAKKPNGAYTNAIYQLATGIPDLYDKGHIMLMSGDPTPNGPDDIVPQLSIADRTKYGSISSLAATVKKTDPLVVRNVLLDFWLLLDEPEDWEEKYVEELVYDLYPEEKQIYRAIFNNDALDSSQKLHMLSLALINPSFFAPGREVKSALFDRSVEKIEEYLADYDAVIVTENTYKLGVTREHETYVGTYYAEKLRQHFKDRADVYIYDGSTPDDERLEIIEKSKRTDRKTIIVCLSSTMDTGTNNFDHIHRAVVLEPSFCRANTAQFVKRFARGSNTDVEATVMRAAGTIHEGINEHAQYKYELTQQMKNGASITQDDYALLERLEDTNIADSITVINGRLFVGTALMHYLITERRNLSLIMGGLQNRGVDYIKEIFTQYGNLIAEIYCKDWEGTMSGNNGRFVVGLIQDLEQQGIVTGNKYGDIACGPLVLERCFDLYGDNDRDRNIQGIDLNQQMIDQGLKMMEPNKPKLEPKLGSMTNLGKLFKKGELDLVNSSLAFEFTSLDAKKADQPEKTERVKTLMEFNRVLKKDGVLVLTMTSRVCSPEQFDTFLQQLSKHFGFEVQQKFSGCAEATDKTDQSRFRNYTLVCKKVGEPNLEGLDIENLTFTRTTQVANGKRHVVQHKVNEFKGCIHTAFRINNTVINVECDDEKSQAEAKYYEEAKLAETFLREIYQKNGNSFDKLSGEDLAEMGRRGIILHDVKVAEDTQLDAAVASPAAVKAGRKKKPRRRPDQYTTKVAFMLQSDLVETPKLFLLSFANQDDEPATEVQETEEAEEAAD